MLSSSPGATRQERASFDVNSEQATYVCGDVGANFVMVIFVKSVHEYMYNSAHVVSF